MSNSNRKFWRSKNAHPLTGLSGVLASATLLGFGVAWTYASYRKAIRNPRPTPDDIAALDTKSIWKSKEGNKYDDEIAWDEWWSGISSKRRDLVRMAQGNVLESAAGTGRNATVYDESKVKSLTLVDQSASMLEMAKKRWFDTKNNLRWQRIKTRFLVGDLGRDETSMVLKPEFIEDKAVLQEAQSHTNVLAGSKSATIQQSTTQTIKGPGDDMEKFDTVVQTMGLCSTPDPVKLLHNLEKVVRSDGKILLLEHGKSHYDWVNELLDRTSLDHAKKHGCWWNRDIGAIVEQSGLQIEEVKRSNFGTLWWIVLRPSAKRSTLPLPQVEAPIAEQQKSSWKFWQ